MPAPLDELNLLLARAQRAGVPLFQFLGGPTRRRVRILAPAPAGPAAATAKAWYLLEATAGSVMPRLPESPSDFALRCGAGMTPANVFSLARRLEEQAPLWISHPDPAVLRRVARETRVPVAAAAHHLDLLKDETADALLLDLPALGLRQCMALAALAETHYVGVAITGCRGAPWRQAGMHLAAALPNFLALEAGDVPLDAEGYAELPL
jgi:galactonate dehydratase